MNVFDRIIGYSEIKQELAQIADALKNKELYASLGAVSPRGLLLHGVPGVGKSLMAKCLMDAAGREVFVCRKTEPDGEFVKTIKETFDRAAENEPCIVFLDDMDKFANDDERHRDSEEFVTVQSCIDEVKGMEVFVLATANEIDKLPRSLVRAGRFDRVIEVETPEGKDAEEIIRHYLADKKLADDLDPVAIAAILEGRSCAALETVINEASLLAGYRRAEHVTMEHIMEACLRLVYELKPGTHTPYDLRVDGPGTRMAYHEAGHAVISELLSPGSVSLVIARLENGHRMGVTHVKKDNGRWDLRFWEKEVMIALAGRDATVMELGAFDTGAGRDLDSAYDAAKHLVEDLCFTGYEHYSYAHREDSETLHSRQEIAITAVVEQYDHKVRDMLCKNKLFVEAVAQALAEKGVLVAADIYRIRENCMVSEIAV